MFKKNSPFLSFVCLATVALALIFATGCGDDKQTTEAKGDSSKANLSSQQSAFTMNCVILTKAQVQTWVDSGWTNPNTPANLIKKILFQFYSADGSGISSNMQLVAYPAKSFTDIYVGGMKILAIDTTCTGMTPSGAFILANNFINFKSLKITKVDGTLEDFSFIRLRPINTHAPYINFDVEVVSVVGVQETILSKGGGTDPCPPYCPNDGD